MAGYGNIAGYEPAEVPGAYRFVGKDGNKWMLSGAPAEDLKAKVDAAQAMGPQPTAGTNPHGTTPRTVTDVPTPVPGAAPFDAKAAASKLLGGAPSAPGGAPAGQPQANKYVQAFQNPDGSVTEFRVGADPNNPQPGDVRVFNPARPGSKGGLQLRSEVRQGVKPLDEGTLETMDNSHIDTLLAMQKKHDVDLEKAELNVQHQNELATIAANQEAEAARRNDEIERQVADFQGRYDKAEKEVANTKIDPKGGSNWLDVVAAGLGSVGSFLTKQPNVALEIVQRKIERHIAKQETELNIKRETKNDLGKMLDATKGNRELARAALNTAYMKKAEATFAAKAAQTGNKELAANFEMLRAATQGDYALRRQGVVDAHRGETTQTLINTPGSAGRAAHYSLPTAGQQQDVKVGMAPQLKPSETGAGPQDANERRYNQTVDDFSNSLAEFVAARGGQMDPETGEITGDLDLPVDLPGGDTDATGGAKSDAVKLGSIYANMMNAGAEAGQPTKEAVTPDLGIGGAPEAQIRAMAREAAIRRQTIRKKTGAQK